MPSSTTMPNSKKPTELAYNKRVNALRDIGVALLLNMPAMNPRRGALSIYDLTFRGDCQAIR